MLDSCSIDNFTTFGFEITVRRVRSEMQPHNLRRQSATRFTRPVGTLFPAHTPPKPYVGPKPAARCSYYAAGE